MFMPLMVICLVSILVDSKWFESIFGILRIGKSLELTMASFKLLNELDKVRNYSP